MRYYNNGDTADRQQQQYEDWQRYGRERGFFDRVSDEVRSWFGDEDAEARRQMDQRMPHVRGNDRMRGEVPEWQNRSYSGSSPRGSSLEPQGRYDESEGWRGGRRERMRSESGFDRTYGRMNEDYDRSGMRRNRYNEENDYYSQPGWRSGGWQTESEPSRTRFFDENRDMETGMPYGNRIMDNRRTMDREYDRGGMFRGRGSRNYQRSDERILDEIHQFLTFHPEIDATDIDVLVESGVVTLRGAVDSRYAKRLAEDVSEEVYGVKEVHNELRVNRSTMGQQNSDSEQMRNRLINPRSI